MPDGVIDAGPDSFESDLVDLSDVDLGQLLELDESVLARSVRRVLAETAEREQIIAGFQSRV